MKIFISWSGALSHKVALILRDWLPAVLQTVEPYVSSEDIDKGTRWSTDISKELEESTYGILCVTSENIEAAWLNFEAGALSKMIDKSRVSPFLFGVKRADVKGPILQFQSTVYEKADVRKLIGSINTACESSYLDENRLDTSFEVWWPRLEELLNRLKESVAKIQDREKKPAEKAERYDEIIEEILDLVRSQQKILSSPEALLPPGYLSEAIRRFDTPPIPRGVYEDLKSKWSELNEFVDSFEGETNMPIVPLKEKLDKLSEPLIYILRKSLGILRRRRKYSPDAPASEF